MAKASRLSRTLPAAVADDLQRTGAAIRAARIARGESQAALAQRLGMTAVTLRQAEQGAPGVSSGILFTLLWALGIGPVSGIIAHQRPELLAPSPRQRVTSARRDPGDF